MYRYLVIDLPHVEDPAGSMLVSLEQEPAEDLDVLMEAWIMWGYYNREDPDDNIAEAFDLGDFHIVDLTEQLKGLP